MRLIAWLLTLAFGMAGLAFREQGGIPFAFSLGTGMLFLAALACPLIWGKPGGMLAFLPPTRGMRLTGGLALILATPLILPWPF
jgi:hypothetical protein